MTKLSLSLEHSFAFGITNLSDHQNNHLCLGNWTPTTCHALNQMKMHLCILKIILLWRMYWIQLGLAKTADVCETCGYIPRIFIDVIWKKIKTLRPFWALVRVTVLICLDRPFIWVILLFTELGFQDQNWTVEILGGPSSWQASTEASGQEKCFSNLFLAIYQSLLLHSSTLPLPPQLPPPPPPPPIIPEHLQFDFHLGAIHLKTFFLSLRRRRQQPNSFCLVWCHDFQSDRC